MLPVISGFIFPNGYKLEKQSLSHRNCAYHYIVENNLINEYKLYKEKIGGDEDNFLVECLGAVKICHYFGNHYIYVSKIYNHYIKELVQIYEYAGYKTYYCYSYTDNNIAVSIENNDIISYNQTVIENAALNGNKCYTYNKSRSGD